MWVDGASSGILALDFAEGSSLFEVPHAALGLSLALHSFSMYSRWDEELETEVMRLCGYLAATKRLTDPHPQPRSMI